MLRLRLVQFSWGKAIGEGKKNLTCSPIRFLYPQIRRAVMSMSQISFRIMLKMHWVLGGTDGTRYYNLTISTVVVVEVGMGKK